MTIAQDYLETPLPRFARWSGSAGTIFALHVAAAVLAFTFWPSDRPRDEEQPGAIMMELDSLAAESPSDQQDLAEQPLFDTSAPPPSPAETLEPIPPEIAPAAAPEAVEQPAPEKLAEAAPPEVAAQEAPPVDEAPLAPEPEVTLPKEAKPKEAPPEEKTPKPIKKAEPVKKPKESVETAAKARETKAAQKSDSKQQRQAAASAKGRFDPNPIYRAKPAYPAGARASKIEGYVVVRYSVSASGSVTSVSVVSASPPGVFNGATLAAVRQWRFKPSPTGGSRSTTVRFKLR